MCIPAGPYTLSFGLDDGSLLTPPHQDCIFQDKAMENQMSRVLLRALTQLWNCKALLKKAEEQSGETVRVLAFPVQKRQFGEHSTMKA